MAGIKICFLFHSATVRHSEVCHSVPQCATVLVREHIFNKYTRRVPTNQIIVVSCLVFLDRLIFCLLVHESLQRGPSSAFTSKIQLLQTQCSCTTLEMSFAASVPPSTDKVNSPDSATVRFPFSPWLPSNPFLLIPQ